MKSYKSINLKVEENTYNDIKSIFAVIDTLKKEFKGEVNFIDEKIVKAIAKVVDLVKSENGLSLDSPVDEKALLEKRVQIEIDNVNKQAIELMNKVKSVGDKYKIKPTEKKDNLPPVKPSIPSFNEPVKSLTTPNN